MVMATVAGIERDGELTAAVGGQCRARGLCGRQSHRGVYDYMSEMSEIHKTGHKFKQFGANDAPRHAEILPRGQFFVLFGHPERPVCAPVCNTDVAGDVGPLPAFKRKRHLKS